MNHTARVKWTSHPLFVLCLALSLALAACATPQEPEPSPTGAVAEATVEVAPTQAPPTNTATLEAPSPTPTAATPTATSTIAASNTPAPTATETAPPATATGTTPQSTPPAAVAQPGAAIIVDHTSIELFDQIPDEYIAAASQLRYLVRHASVGHNVDNALNCLMDDSGSPPNFCSRGLPAGQIVHDGKYDRSNWTFELHATPNANPGWNNKVLFFIERADELQVGQNYDLMNVMLAYLDGAPGSTLDDLFFDREENREVGIVELEALLERHPDTEMIWSTLALARIIGGEDSDSFNRQLRDYVRANGGYLLDIADIESHTPDGAPCLEGGDAGFPVLCQEYTEESRGGHLNALGSQRIARALWVLMARIAGWQGN